MSVNSFITGKGRDTEFIKFGRQKVNGKGECIEGLCVVDPPERVTHCGTVYEYLRQTIMLQQGPLEGENFHYVRDLITNESLWVSDSREGKFSQCMIPFEMRREPIVIF